MQTVAICSLVISNATLAGTLCALSGDNYIINPDFSERSTYGSAKYWTGIRHAGEKSFEMTIDGEELTIQKFGSQPWFLLRQSIEAQQLAGKKVAYTAEIRLDMHSPTAYTPLKMGGGLHLTVKSKSSNKVLLRSTLDHDPHNGKSGWQKIQVVVRLPKKTGAIELGVLHQGDGELSIRRPSFSLIDESERKCKRTPGVRH